MAKQGIRWGTWLKRAAAVALGLVVVTALWVRSRMQGPHRDYRADVEFVSTGAPDLFEVGVAARNITPDLAKFDPWKDADGDSRFRPDKGDTW
ncbi:MAG: hypothetical protein IT581_16385, partial [Verrucomicrobiales bacterium]|nr:hypothetical protein [Verrucomicrobiales bacterium]